MTEHDRIRMLRAAACDINDLESLSDAIRGLQSTDDPSLVPLHDELMKRWQELKKLKEQETRGRFMEPIKTIGQFLKGGEDRDCIHIAIMPAIAADGIYRSQEVGLAYGTTDPFMAKYRGYGLDPIGIVDPFLKDYKVEKRTRIWVFLFPGSIVGLRHHLLARAVAGVHKWLKQQIGSFHSSGSRHS
jgi:hypothetical protein